MYDKALDEFSQMPKARRVDALQMIAYTQAWAVEVRR
jgi:hypothetical protein